MLANIEELERLQPLLREARSEDKAQTEAAAREQAQAAAEDAIASRMAELEAVIKVKHLTLPMGSQVHALQHVLKELHMYTVDMQLQLLLDSQRCPRSAWSRQSCTCHALQCCLDWCKESLPRFPLSLMLDVWLLQSKLEAEQQAESARAEAEAARSEVAELQSSLHSAQSTDAAVHRLVELLYFSTVGECHDTKIYTLCSACGTRCMLCGICFWQR